MREREEERIRDNRAKFLVSRAKKGFANRLAFPCLLSAVKFVA